jgi:transposase-like protein
MEDVDDLGYYDPERLKEIIYWTTLALRLPPDQVDLVFPTEDACRERLISVRWPEGVKCPFCGVSDISELMTSQRFRCRSCRAQFSATSGTFLHNTHIPILLWFVAAECLIRTYVGTGCTVHVSGRYLARKLGRSYRTAVRMKKILLMDIDQSGPGHVRDSVCLDHFSLPDDMEPGSARHASWLLASLMEPRKSAW